MGTEHSIYLTAKDKEYIALCIIYFTSIMEKFNENNLYLDTVETIMLDKLREKVWFATGKQYLSQDELSFTIMMIDYTNRLLIDYLKQFDDETKSFFKKSEKMLKKWKKTDTDIIGEWLSVRPRIGKELLTYK